MFLGFSSCGSTKSPVRVLTFINPVYPMLTVFRRGCCIELVEDIEGIENEETQGHSVEVGWLKAVGEESETSFMVGDMFRNVQIYHLRR